MNTAFNLHNFPRLPGSFPSLPGIIISNIEDNLNRPSFYKILKENGIQPKQIFLPREIQNLGKPEANGFLPLHLRGFAFLYFASDEEARNSLRALRGMTGNLGNYNEWSASWKVNNTKTNFNKEANIFFKNLRKDITLKEFSEFLFEYEFTKGYEIISLKIKPLDGENELPVGYAQFRNQNEAENFLRNIQDTTDEEKQLNIEAKAFLRSKLGQTVEIKKFQPYKQRQTKQTTIYLKDFIAPITEYENLSADQIANTEKEIQERLRNELTTRGYNNIVSIFVKINRLFKSPMAFITFNNSDSADKAVLELPKGALFDEQTPYVNYQESALQREKNKKRHLSNKIDGNSRFVYMKNLDPTLTEEKLTQVLNDNGYYVDSVKIKKPDSLVDNNPAENSQPSQMATIKMRNEILGQKLVNALNRGFQQLEQWAKELFKHGSSYVSFLQTTAIMQAKNKRNELNNYRKNNEGGFMPYGYPMMNPFNPPMFVQPPMFYPPNMNLGGFPGNYPPQMGPGFFNPPFPNHQFPSLPNNQNNFHPHPNFNQNQNHFNNNNSNQSHYQNPRPYNNNNRNYSGNNTQQQPHQRINDLNKSAPGNRTQTRPYNNNNNYNNNDNRRPNNNNGGYNNGRSPPVKSGGQFYQGNNNNATNNRGGRNNNQGTTGKKTAPNAPPTVAPKEAPPTTLYVAKTIVFDSIQVIKNNLSAFLQEPVEKRKANLGRILFTKIPHLKQIQPLLTDQTPLGKIVGMLTDYDNFTDQEIIDLVTDEADLTEQVKDAIELLKSD